MFKKIKNWVSAFFCNNQELRAQLKQETIRADTYRDAYFNLKSQIKTVIREATDPEKSVKLEDIRL